MPGSSRSEIYFISAMMLLIMVLCIGAVFFFIKTYKKEMREKAERLAIKAKGGADVNAPAATLDTAEKSEAVTSNA